MFIEHSFCYLFLTPGCSCNKKEMANVFDQYEEAASRRPGAATHPAVQQPVCMLGTVFLSCCWFHTACDLKMSK